MNVEPTHDRNNKEIFDLQDFDISSILQKIDVNGAASLKILNEDFRKQLIEESKVYNYKEEDEYAGSGDQTVVQQMETLKELPYNSNFLLLRSSFNKLMERRISSVSPYPFESELNLNSSELIRYRKGSSGITPHRDGLNFRNLVCVFNISGKGRFFICSDRSGNNSVEFDSTPGNVVMMRAPGFMGSYERPFHFVEDISEERYVFVLRQKC